MLVWSPHGESAKIKTTKISSRAVAAIPRNFRYAVLAVAMSK
jgi:hypothetical protein